MCKILKLNASTNARIFHNDIELDYRLNGNCSVFQVEIFAILNNLKSVPCNTVSNANFYMIFLTVGLEERRSKSGVSS